MGQLTVGMAATQVWTAIAKCYSGLSVSFFGTEISTYERMSEKTKANLLFDSKITVLNIFAFITALVFALALIS